MKIKAGDVVICHEELKGDFQDRFITYPDSKKSKHTQLWNCKKGTIMYPLPPNNESHLSKGTQNLASSQCWNLFLK